MCGKTLCCQRPEKLSGKPEECSPEQIKACHKDEDVHPCVPQDRRKRKGDASG